jgi:hypothetical protein
VPASGLYAGLRTKRLRLRAAADEACQALLERAAEMRDAADGSVLEGCLASGPDPRSRRRRRHSLPCVVTLVLPTMPHGKSKLADVTVWITHADQEALAEAGARAGRDGRLQAALSLCAFGGVAVCLGYAIFAT